MVELNEQSLSASSIYRIGLWGVARAGKTVYLALLYHTLMQKSDEWRLDCDAAAQQFIHTAYERLFQRRAFLEKTSAVAVYVYTLTHKATGYQVILTFMDAPGEIFERYYHPDQRDQAPAVAQQTTDEVQADRTPRALIAELRAMDALLLFLEPAWEQSTEQNPLYMNLLRQLLQDLGRGQVLALCVTKVDGNDDLWNKRQHGETCGRHRQPPQFDQCAEHCNVYRVIGRQFMTTLLPGLVEQGADVSCFSLSAIGRRETDRSNVTEASIWERAPLPAADLPKFSTAEQLALTVDPHLPEHVTTRPRAIIDPDQIAPFQVWEPVAWVLNRLAEREQPTPRAASSPSPTRIASTLAAIPITTEAKPVAPLTELETALAQPIARRLNETGEVNREGADPAASG